MATMWACACGALNQNRARACTICGAVKQRAVLEVQTVACPLCRSPLDRVGGCLRCHGCTTGRKEDWTFPGAYEDLPAGRSSCTPRENVAAMQIVQAVLAKKMTVTEAEDHLATIFQGRERLDARLALTP